MARTPGASPILSEVYDPLFAVTAKLEKAVGLTRDSMSLLRIPVMKLAGFMQESVQVQKTSLQFNRTFNQSISKLGTTMDGLPGGLMTSMQSLFAFEQQGLTEVSKSALNLANRMTITGQNIGALVKLNKVALTQGLFNNQELSNLNQGTLDLAVQFGISTDLLVGSMSNLSKSISILGLTGAAPSTLKAVRDLTAQFPHLGDSISGFVNALVKGDIGNLARLGILKDVNSLVSGGMNANQLIALISKTTAGVNQLGDFRGAGIIEARVLESLAGPGGILAKQLTEGMANIPAQTPLGREDQIFADFTTALKTDFLPALKALTAIFTPFLSIAGKIIGGLEKFRIVSTLVLTRVIMGLAVQTKELVKNGLGMKRLGLELRALAVKVSGGTVGMSTMRGAMGAGAILGLALPLVGAIVIPLLLPVLLGLNNSVDKLSQAEADKQKAQLRAIDERKAGRSEFEAVTKTLFNTSIKNIGAAASAHVMLSEEVQKMADAVAVYTGVTEDQTAEFSLTKARTLGQPT